MPVRAVLATFALALALATTSSCGLGGSGPDQTLTVLAGSELADIQPVLDDLEAETGIRLELELTGTLDGAERLIGGEDHDLAWFSHARYLDLLAEGTGIIAAQEPMMLSPVVLGVKSQTAEQLGWVDNPAVTWADIADASAAGDLRFAMANPASSNSGFTGLIGVTAALAGTSDAFGQDDIDTEGLLRFFAGQTLTAGSSGWLADAYAQSQESLDGMINYESVLLSLNEQGRLADELVLVYPSEGIVTADYPLLLLDEEQRDTYNTVIEYLRRPEVQQRIMADTLRRPAIPGIELDPRIPDPVLVELPFPRSQAVIDAVLFAYLDELRPPSTTIYVLDLSGSMAGQPLADLKQALLNLTGADDSLTGRFARFRSRERVVLIPFASSPMDPAEFQLPDGEVTDSPEVEELSRYIDGLSASGGTAIYDALTEAYLLAEQLKGEDPDRFYSIVLLSDGAVTEGREFVDFELDLANGAFAGSEIRTFPVLFGAADEQEMKRVADSTGGRVFDSGDGLGQAFKTIRGYQ
jgi:Ca-activated chloride channel family protein